MNARHVGILAAIIGVFGVALQYANTQARGYVAPDSIPEWAFITTEGASALLYQHLILMTVAVLTIGVALVSGYVMGPRVDLPANYREVVGAIAIGSAIGVVVAHTFLLRPTGGVTRVDPTVGTGHRDPHSASFVRLSNR